MKSNYRSQCAIALTAFVWLAASGVVLAVEPSVADPAAVDPAAGNTASPATSQEPAPTSNASAATPASTPVRVIYLPESEKKRIRDEIRDEVMATARAENWAQPHTFPEWVNRIRFEGDLRVRYEGDYFNSGNYPYFINYQGINSGAPFDVSGQSGLPPIVNTTEDRQRLRLRARLGMNADVADDLAIHFRLATGNTTGLTSTSQTLGSDFNKLAFSLDRAYFDYRAADSLSLLAGRMGNPWFSTELLWDENLSFDGIAAKYRFNDAGTFTPFVTVGAFSVENTAVDLPSNSVNKLSSRDKWLYAAQVGSDWHIQPDSTLRLGLAYYYFDKIKGESSSPCAAYTATYPCDTDSSRPGFLQYGNTLFSLRNLNLSANPSGPQYQYFGLASAFNELDLLTTLDIARGEGKHLIWTADYVINLGWDENRIRLLGPVNNASSGHYDGGNQGYLLKTRYGFPKPSERGEWNIEAGYRYLQSDAVVDAFTDADFHLGGTNAKGYFVSGSLGFTHNAWLTLRYLSSNEVSGAPYAVDILQVDVNGRF